MAKRKIDDFGAKIGGARKDMWKTNGLSYDDLAGMNDAEYAKYVNKNNIWPKPDWSERIKAGTPQAVAFWQNEVRKALKSAPVSAKKEDEENYVKFASALRDAVMNVKEEDEVSRFYEDFFVDREYLTKTGLSYVKPSPETAGIIDNKLLRAVQVTCMSYYKGRREVREFGLTDAEKKRMNCTVLQYDEKKVKADRAQGTVSVMAPGCIYWCMLNGCDIEDLKPGTWMVFYSESKKCPQLIAYNLSSEKEAEDFADAFAKADKTPEKKARASKAAFKMPYLSDMKREGPDVLGWRHADTDMYLDDLKFKGGEFGNWVNDTERETDLDLGYEAFTDLSDTLGIRPESVSLDGTLSIAFGSRGTGGSGAARAHYEPLRKVINLTKKKGGGCLAHEWGHALDHMIGEKSGAPAGKLASEAINDKNASLPLEFKAVVDGLSYKLHFLSEDEQKAESANTRMLKKRSAERYINHYRPFSANTSPERKEEWDGLVKDLLDADIPENAYQGDVTVPELERINDLCLKERCMTPVGISLKDKNAICSYVRAYQKAKADAETWVPGRYEKKEMTQYKKASEKFDAVYKKENFGYWASDEEMFARAFDCYVSDKLKEAGRENDYLTAYSDTFVMDTGKETFRAYPEGDERKEINALFDRLFTKLKELGWLKEKGRKQTFNVYQECVTRITIDVPEDATVEEVNNAVTAEYETGKYPHEISYAFTDIEGVPDNRGKGNDSLFNRDWEEKYF